MCLSVLNNRSPKYEISNWLCSSGWSDFSFYSKSSCQTLSKASTIYRNTAEQTCFSLVMRSQLNYWVYCWCIVDTWYIVVCFILDPNWCNRIKHFSWIRSVSLLSVTMMLRWERKHNDGARNCIFIGLRTSRLEKKRLLQNIDKNGFNIDSKRVEQSTRRYMQPFEIR